MQLELSDGTCIQADAKFEYTYNELVSRKNLKVEERDKLLLELKDKQQNGGTISDYFWFQIKQAALPVIQGQIADLYGDLETLFKKHNVVKIIK